MTRRPASHQADTISSEHTATPPLTGGPKPAKHEPMLDRCLRPILAGALLAALALPADAQQRGSGRPDAASPLFAPRPLTTPPPQGPSAVVQLVAVFGGAATQPVTSGVQWRVFREQAEADGMRQMVGESADATLSLELPNGDYIVHVAYGLAGATKRISVNGQDITDRVPLNAGGLKVAGMLGDQPIAPNRQSLSVFVPDRGNAEAKLVASDLKAGELLRLPEGTYHVVSTYLDAPAAGSNGAGNATNSIVDADVRVQAGKLTEATLRHRAAVMTLKLVNAAGGEALANTSFTVLTPGGDVIREMIGAFPSLPLAEGEYVVIARRDGKTHQATFTVQSARDRDVEVLAN